MSRYHYYASESGIRYFMSPGMTSEGDSVGIYKWEGKLPERFMDKLGEVAEKLFHEMMRFVDKNTSIHGDGIK